VINVHGKFGLSFATFLTKSLEIKKRGHKEEITLIEYLEMAGHTFLPRPIGKDGKPEQHRIEKFALGHGGGSCDELGYPPLQYMYGPEFGCDFCLYLCVNKDDDDIHWEIVCLNPAIRDELKMKAHDIVTSQIPPHKFSGTKTKNLAARRQTCIAKIFAVSLTFVITENK